MPQQSRRRLVCFKEPDVSLPGYKAFQAHPPLDLYPPTDLQKPGRWASKAEMDLETSTALQRRGRLGCNTLPNLKYHREAGNRWVANTPAKERTPVRDGLMAMRRYGEGVPLPSRSQGLSKSLAKSSSLGTMDINMSKSWLVPGLDDMQDRVSPREPSRSSLIMPSEDLKDLKDSKDYKSLSKPLERYNAVIGSLNGGGSITALEKSQATLLLCGSSSKLSMDTAERPASASQLPDEWQYVGRHSKFMTSPDGCFTRNYSIYLP